MYVLGNFSVVSIGLISAAACLLCESHRIAPYRTRIEGGHEAAEVG